MAKPKKTDSVHVKLPAKAKLRIGEVILANMGTYNNEAALLIIDGLIARECISEQYLKDNRKKFM